MDLVAQLSKTCLISSATCEAAKSTGSTSTASIASVRNGDNVIEQMSKSMYNVPFVSGVLPTSCAHNAAMFPEGNSIKEVHQPVVIMGAGRLGESLITFPNFQVVGLFDVDPNKVGMCFGQIQVESVDAMPKRVFQLRVERAIIAVPPDAAQTAANELVGAGVRVILNYSPTNIVVPLDVVCERVDPANQFSRMLSQPILPRPTAFDRGLFENGAPGIPSTHHQSPGVLAMSMSHSRQGSSEWYQFLKRPSSPVIRLCEALLSKPPTFVSRNIGFVHGPHSSFSHTQPNNHHTHSNSQHFRTINLTNLGWSNHKELALVITTDNDDKNHRIHQEIANVLGAWWNPNVLLVAATSNQTTEQTRSSGNELSGASSYFDEHSLAMEGNELVKPRTASNEDSSSVSTFSSNGQPDVGDALLPMLGNPNGNAQSPVDALSECGGQQIRPCPSPEPQQLDCPMTPTDTELVNNPADDMQVSRQYNTASVVRRTSTPSPVSSTIPPASPLTRSRSHSPPPTVAFSCSLRQTIAKNNNRTLSQQKRNSPSAAQTPSSNSRHGQKEQKSFFLYLLSEREREKFRAEINTERQQKHVKKQHKQQQQLQLKQQQQQLDRMRCKSEQSLSTLRGQSTNNKAKRIISSAKLARRPNVRWSSVAGLELMKQTLQEALELPLEHPQHFPNGATTWNSMLLYGPPGCGKTMLAKAVATELFDRYTFFHVKAADLQGEANVIGHLFEMACEAQPSVLFIDNIEVVCRRSTHGKQKSELCHQLELLSSKADACNVFVMAATNLPWELDVTVLRHFEKRMLVPLPDADARELILRIHMEAVCRFPQNRKSMPLTGPDFKTLIDATEGYSASDIALVVKNALFLPIRESGKSSTPPREVQVDDFVESIKSVRPTLTKEIVHLYERFTEKFGEADQQTTERLQRLANEKLDFLKLYS